MNIRRLILAGLASIAFVGVLLWGYDRVNYKILRYIEATTGDFVSRRMSLFSNEIVKREPTILLPRSGHPGVMIGTYERRNYLWKRYEARGSGDTTLYDTIFAGKVNVDADWSTDLKRIVSDVLWEASDRRDSEAVELIVWTAVESPDDVKAAIHTVRDRWQQEKASTVE